MHTLRMLRSIVFIELRATEPAEDALHPEKIHTGVLLYGEDSLLCYTLTTKLQPILRHCTTVLTTVLHYSPPLCPSPWPVEAHNICLMSARCTGLEACALMNDILAFCR